MMVALEDTSPPVMPSPRKRSPVHPLNESDAVIRILNWAGMAIAPPSPWPWHIAAIDDWRALVSSVLPSPFTPHMATSNLPSNSLRRNRWPAASMKTVHPLSTGLIGSVQDELPAPGSGWKIVALDKNRGRPAEISASQGGDNFQNQPGLLRRCSAFCGGRHRNKTEQGGQEHSWYDRNASATDVAG